MWRAELPLRKVSDNLYICLPWQVLKFPKFVVATSNEPWKHIPISLTEIALQSKRRKPSETFIKCVLWYYMCITYDKSGTIRYTKHLNYSVMRRNAGWVLANEYRRISVTNRDSCTYRRTTDSMAFDQMSRRDGVYLRTKQTYDALRSGRHGRRKQRRASNHAWPRFGRAHARRELNSWNGRKQIGSKPRWLPICLMPYAS